MSSMVKMTENKQEERGKIELTGGAELKFCNWTIKFRERGFGLEMIVKNIKGIEYRFADTSNGWADIEENGQEVTIYGPPQGYTKIFRMGLK